MTQVRGPCPVPYAAPPAASRRLRGSPALMTTVHMADASGGRRHDSPQHLNPEANEGNSAFGLSPPRLSRERGSVVHALARPTGGSSGQCCFGRPSRRRPGHRDAVSRRVTVADRMQTGRRTDPLPRREATGCAVERPRLDFDKPDPAARPLALLTSGFLARPSAARRSRSRPARWTETTRGHGDEADDSSPGTVVPLDDQLHPASDSPCRRCQGSDRGPRSADRWVRYGGLTAMSRPRPLGPAPRLQTLARWSVA